LLLCLHIYEINFVQRHFAIYPSFKAGRTTDINDPYIQLNIPPSATYSLQSRRQIKANPDGYPILFAQKTTPNEIHWALMWNKTQS